MSTDQPNPAPHPSGPPTVVPTPDAVTAARDIAEVSAVEVITTAAVHLMSAAAVRCGLEEGPQATAVHERNPGEIEHERRVEPHGYDQPIHHDIGDEAVEHAPLDRTLKQSGHTLRRNYVNRRHDRHKREVDEEAEDRAIGAHLRRLRERAGAS